MHQPRFRFFAALLAYTVLAKMTPYLLMAFGMSINPETTIYPWGFSPVPAVCLFGAAVFRDRRWAFLLPLTAWLLGDLALFALFTARDGLSQGVAMAFYPAQVFIYCGFALVVCCGMWLRRRRTPGRIAVAGFAGSTLFYLVTNFAVWVIGPESYPNTFGGLVQCYIAGLPFYRNFLIATLGFSAILFSSLETWTIESGDGADGEFRLQPALAPRR